MSDQSRSPCYFVDADEGCALEAYPGLLVDAWAARYNAVKQMRQGSRWVVAGETFVKACFPLEIYFVPRTHEGYLAAVMEAHAISSLLALDPYNATIYYLFRFRLQDAGYTESQLESAPRPQETICLHMLTNGAFTCVGKIHRASRAGDERRWYYCSDCCWTSPSIEGVTRRDLRDEGLFLVPLDASSPVPFAEPEQGMRWTRRVLLQHGFMLTLTSAASLLDMTRQALRDLCVLGLFHRFEHPTIPDESILYRSEIEAFRHTCYQP